MLEIRPIHPFPARMAPEIVLQVCDDLPAGALVLDPMAGSGTVLRFAAEGGCRAVGLDLDPLSAMMAKVWTTPLRPEDLRRRAFKLVAEARELSREFVQVPWIDSDLETRHFVNYWFGKKQRGHLRALAVLLNKERGSLGNALRIALSRTIITKEPRASLARDTSHSRPHRVMTSSTFDVLDGFARSAGWLARRFAEQPPPGGVSVRVGDARRIRGIAAASIDAVISSPPYLNAIDYMRGHRLSLVWLGYGLQTLRSTRSNSVGAERSMSVRIPLSVEQLASVVDPAARFPRRLRRIVERYADDMLHVVSQIERVLRPGAAAVLTVGNSCVQGNFVESAHLVSAAANMVGLTLEDRLERPLPAAHRYLPPPGTGSRSGLDNRIRTETVMRFRKTAHRRAA